MAVGLPDSLDSLLDSAPPVHEVCEHVRVTNWYQLGIQLLLDGVELEEIRKDADKRDRMYQLWLRTQPDSTRRQLLTALRSKDVGENVVADKYQQHLSEMTAANTPQQINERPKARRKLSNPVVDILCEKIEQVPDLAAIASNLKKEFRSLLMNVQDSVKECHLSKVISLIRLHVVECLGPISESIELYKQKLSSIHTVHEVFAFLIDNHFVGYLNYVLLKEISELEDNLEVKIQFDQYERIYKYLLNASTFNLLIQVFDTYPDLSPTTAIGLPEMMFQLKSPWSERSVSTWKEYINDKFPNWARSLAPKEFSSECLIVKYAILPSALPAVLEDLEDPVASKELENIGAVTLVQLPDDDIAPKKDEKSTGKIIRVIHKWTPSILWSSAKNVRTTLKSMLQVALSNQHELRMLVTGKTGQGKSTLINGIIGKQIAIEGAGTTRSTENVMKHTCNICDVPVTVFDSPGLQDRSVNEKEYIESLTNQCKDLSLVLYCTKMINHRITDDDENAMKKLTKAFGEKFWNYAVLVLTFANMESCDRKDSRDENVVEPDLDDEKGWELLEKKRFEHRLKKWETELKTFLTCEVGVSQKIVERIPVIPTGDYKITRRNRNPMHLPDRDSWFNSFWEACCLRVKETKLFLQINQDRMIVAENSSDTHRGTPEDHCEIIRLSKLSHSFQSKLETEEKEHFNVPSTVYQPQLVREKDTTKDISTQCKESLQSPSNNHPATSDIPITDKFATEVTRHIIERWFGESFGNFIKTALDIIGRPAEWFIGLFKRT